MLRYLVTHERCDPSKANGNGATPLLAVACAKQADAAQWLLMHGGLRNAGDERDPRLVGALVDWRDLPMLSQFMDALGEATPALLDRLAEADWAEAVEMHGGREALVASLKRRTQASGSSQPTRRQRQARGAGARRVPS